MADNESSLEMYNEGGRVDPDIESILEAGYEQLDSFARWLERQMGLAARACERDCFNAETLIDYLANFRRKSSTDIAEFDLRWFMLSHYIRKAGADRETEERLPISLQNLYTYLEKNHGYSPAPWLWVVLEDHGAFLKRCREYAQLDSEDERAWSVGFTIWCQELDDDLDARCLSLPKELSHNLTWADRMGWREATLWEAANNLWQEERDVLLAEGMGYDDVRERLVASFRSWVDTPQARLDGKTPVETILEEQQDAADARGSEEVGEADGD